MLAGYTGMSKRSTTIRAMLLGAVAGARSMTPLAAVANAARTKRLPKHSDAPDFLASPLVSMGTMALAIYEVVGDKQPSAPDRIITPAVVVRTFNAAVAGAAIAPRKHRLVAAAVAGTTAVAMSWFSWKVRLLAMRSHGQTSTGFVEDALAVPVAIAASTRRLG